MSRSYSMAVRISDYNPAKAEAIQNAASEEWTFDDWWDYGAEGQPTTQSDAEGSLCGGESEEEFVDRLTHAIWTANDAFCTVYISCTYLEDLPCEAYALDANEYNMWKARQRTEQNLEPEPLLPGEDDD